jgi:heme oxygenase
LGRAFHARLRAATSALHDEVDALFGRFDLADAASYADFLTVHAKALIPVEDWADYGHFLFDWTCRKVPLYQDLAALGRLLPSFEPLDWPREPATRWGAAYVLEGSRLGGGMLARRVGPGLPRAYLGAVHKQGGWQSFLRAMEAQAQQGGQAWQDAAIVSAKRTFALYARAARSMQPAR